MPIPHTTPIALQFPQHASLVVWRVLLTGVRNNVNRDHPDFRRLIRHAEQEWAIERAKAVRKAKQIAPRRSPVSVASPPLQAALRSFPAVARFAQQPQFSRDSLPSKALSPRFDRRGA